MSTPTPFHRLFGLLWIDFFDGTDVLVETELDLSIKLQFLDTSIIRKGSTPLPRRMPDGLEFLPTYTLMSFKSYQQAFGPDAMWELIGHFANYRKRVSPSLKQLLPAEEFLLVAVTVRFPEKLASEMTLIPVRPGVYDVTGIGLRVRVLVVNELPKEEHNAMLHLFSQDEDLIRYGREHYRPHSEGTSTLLYQLLRAYGEDESMSEKMKEFVRQTIDEILSCLPAEERLKGLPAEERLKGLPAEELRKALPVEERLKGLPAEERLKGLPAEELRKALPIEERLKGLPAEELRKALPVEERLKGLSVDEVMKALSPEMLEALTRQTRGNGNTPRP